MTLLVTNTVVENIFEVFEKQCKLQKRIVDERLLSDPRVVVQLINVSNSYV